MKTFQFALTLICCLMVVGLSAQTAAATCKSSEKVSACKSKAASTIAVSLTEQANCKPGDPDCEPCPPGCCKAMSVAAASVSLVAQTVALAAKEAQKTTAPAACQPLKCQPANCKPSASKTEAKVLATVKR